MPTSGDSRLALSSVEIGSVLAGAEGLASVSARLIAASTIFFAGAGVKALVVSMTASSMLAILLLGVIAGALIIFGNPESAGGSRSLAALLFPLALALWPPLLWPRHQVSMFRLARL